MAEWHYIAPPEVVEKGGKGSGWFAPPKGTHIGRYTRRGKGRAAPSFAAMTKLQGRENKLSDRLAELRVGFKSLKPKYRKQRQVEMQQIRQKLGELARRKKKLVAAQRAEWRRKKQAKGKAPPDMSKWKSAQHKKSINALAKKPLKELRRRQDLVVSQRKSALQQLKRTKDPMVKERLERGLRNLDVMDKHLIAAIDKKEFG